VVILRGTEKAVRAVYNKNTRMDLESYLDGTIKPPLSLS